MPKLIARWNPARDVWETETTGLFCEHSDVFSETWPASGMTRGGVAYELPTSGHRTDGSASSSLLGTPRDSPAMTASTMEQVRRTGHWGEGGGRLEEQIATLLPTPVADHSRGLPQPGTDYASLPNVVMDLLPTPNAAKAANDMDLTCSGDGREKPNKLGWALTLLPTPVARDWKGHGPADMDRHSPNMSAVSAMLLPTPTPTAQAAKHAADDRGLGTLDDCNLWSVAARIANQQED